jgi:hypothetical protein
VALEHRWILLNVVKLGPNFLFCMPIGPSVPYCFQLYKHQEHTKRRNLLLALEAVLPHKRMRGFQDRQTGRQAVASEFSSTTT